jgi:hypothetical protein
MSTQKEPEKEDAKSSADKVYAFAKTKIKKFVTSKDDTNNVFILVKRKEHYELKELETKISELWLKSEYFKAKKTILGDQSFSRALAILYAEGIDSESEKIYNRVAVVDNTLYYDLGRPDWKVMRIDGNGVEMVEMNENTPLFERRQNIQPQVEFDNSDPKALDELSNLLRIPENRRHLFKVQLVSLNLEPIPVPMMVFSGEQGSAKTTTSRAVKQIIDPAAGGNAIAFPRSNEDLILNLSHRYLTTFDNVSLIDKVKSDTLCTAITGIGQAKRKLFHDQEEVILSYRRKIIINGIGITIERPDLLDRSIFYHLESPKPTERITEEEFNERFSSLLPKVLGNIASILKTTLATRHQIGSEIGKKSRMADFMVYGEAISRALGYERNSFVNLLNDTMEQKAIETIENHPLVRAIEIIIGNQNHYEKTVQGFFDEIRNTAVENNLNTNQSFFPSSANRVRGAIERISSYLRKLGYEISISQYTKNDGVHPKNRFVIYIDKVDELISPTSTESVKTA